MTSNYLTTDLAYGQLEVIIQFKEEMIANEKAWKDSRARREISVLTVKSLISCFISVVHEVF